MRNGTTTSPVTALRPAACARAGVVSISGHRIVEACCFLSRRSACLLCQKGGGGSNWRRVRGRGEGGGAGAPIRGGPSFSWTILWCWGTRAHTAV
eukprot:scaffold187758_cov32-Tisochrysis_lutea.AAC.2